MNPTQNQDARCPDPTHGPAEQTDRYDITAAGLLALGRIDEAAEVWGDNELDYDRIPTREGFQAWCAGKAVGTASSPDEPGSVPDVLRSAALYLKRHGWIQGAYYDGTSGVFTPSACVVGAIGMVCYGGPVDAPAQMFGHEGFAEFEAAVLHLDRYLLVEDGTEAYEFNDAKGRTVEDVVYALRQAAGTPEHELIDALQAIDEMNERLAESGVTIEQIVALLDGGDI